MTPQTSASSGCIFCQIISGQRPAEVIFESETTVAFLDRFPVARGHTLVVPRHHAATLLDLEEGAAGALFGGLVEVVDLLSATLRPVGFNIGWNHGAAAGQHVFHLHVHVLPRFEGGGGGVQAVGEGARGVELGQVAAAVRRGLGRGTFTPRARLVPATFAGGSASPHRPPHPAPRAGDEVARAGITGLGARRRSLPGGRPGR